MSGKGENRDFEFLRLLLRYQQQNYYELKEECLRKGELFEDDLFPACSNSYFLKQSTTRNKKKNKIEWIRPHQIISSDESSQPQFIQFKNSLFLRKATSIEPILNPNSSNAKVKSFKYQLSFMKGHGSPNFVSALSILYWNSHYFAHVVPHDQSFDTQKYAGIFHFRIWQYGKWYDIVVDDRLPTINGKLIQIHTFKNLEFWPALLEKAFAKLNGSYQSLHGCTLNEFLEDMTGGLCESINSEMPDILNEGLFKILCKSLEFNSHIIVRISDRETDTSKQSRNQLNQKNYLNNAKRQLSNGLIKNQSYIVMEARYLDYNGPDKIVYLIKICNPWKRLNQLTSPMKCKGCKDSSNPKSIHLFDGNWIGSWSEDSSEWINLPDSIKAKYELILDNDHEFWMPIESFVENFTDVDICHIDNSVASACLAHESAELTSLWHSIKLDGNWITGNSAGGCYNQDSFHTNPIYLVPIKDGNSKPSAGVSISAMGNKNVTLSTPSFTILIGLMQKYRNTKRVTGLYDLKIGFHLFKLEKDDWNYVEEVIYDDDINFSRYNSNKHSRDIMNIMLKMKPEFFHTRKGEHAIQFFTNIREVCARYKLNEGYYLLIPSTYGPNCDGNFLLRFYCEVPLKFVSKEIASLIQCDNSKPYSVNQNANDMYFLNRLFSRPIEKISWFDECVDSQNLELLLKSVIPSPRNHFSLDQCLTLLALYDLEYKGTLSYVQLQQLCIDIDECYQLFRKHDKTGSRSISCSELKSALREIGIHVSQRVIKMFVNRYGSHMKIVVKGVPIRELKFTNFAICLLKLRKTLIYWDVKFRNSTLPLAQTEYKSESNTVDKRHPIQDSNNFNFTLLEFVQQVIYS